MAKITAKDVDSTARALKDIQKFVSQKGTVTPETGGTFKTAPQIAEEAEQLASDTIQALQLESALAVEDVINHNMTRGFATQALLRAWKPNFNGARAKADDTKKIWRWELTSAAGVTPIAGNWVDTGLSELDQALSVMSSNANFSPVKIANISLDTLTNVGQYIATNVSDATLANSYPVSGLGGILHVVSSQSSSLVFQEFKAANGVDYWRSYNGSTWTTWKLKIDLAPYEQSAKSFTDLGAIAVGTDLNALQTSGRYSLSDGSAWATTALNFPVDGFSGTVEVVKNSGSTIVLQRAVRWISASNIETYTRMFRSAWSGWKVALSDASLFEPKSNAFTDLGSLTSTNNLNDLKVVGRYSLSDGSTWATTELGYPKNGVSGVLEVLKNTSSSIVTQKFTVWNSTAPELWIRVFRGSWSNWVKAGFDLNATNTYKVQATITNATVLNDLRSEAAIYIVNNNTTVDLLALGFPENSLGTLRVNKGSVSGFATQDFVAYSSGKTHVRYWNGSAWSTWSSLKTESSEVKNTDLITFTKTATQLTWFLPNSGNGTNKLRHTFVRGVTANINRDSWGMSTASVYSQNNTLIQNLTTNGVWECAIIDSQNVGDHSGGGHGDEAKFLSYFLVDGVKYDEDFTGTFTAKEVKHIQHSVIYVEAQNIPICTRKTTWTINKDVNTSRTKLEWAAGRTITKARIVMLPIYRKSKQDGTGDQITDTEIRSQDDQIINVSEHGFPMRDLPIKDGDSILLSSNTSNISAELKIKKIDTQDPHAYVQNTILYNKIYVNGFAETAAPFITGENDIWEIETDFVIKVRS